jgi:hypothetical protein
MFGTYTGNNTFFELTLSGNALNGVLPDNLLGTPKYSELKSFTLKLDQNQFVGDIPYTLFDSFNLFLCKTSKSTSARTGFLEAPPGSCEASPSPLVPSKM